MALVDEGFVAQRLLVLINATCKLTPSNARPKHTDVSIPYKNQNITFISKVIKRVRKILNYYLIIKTTLIFIFL